MKIMIIAEAGVNHNGKLDLALKLCEKAKETGADAVKFQTFKTERLLTKNACLADYQKNSINKNNTQFDLIKKLELSFDDFKKVKEHCDLIKIEFMSTPDDEESLDFLVEELKISKIKIGSGEVTNIPFLRKIGKKNKSIILSTGMSDLQEIALAINELKNNGSKDITLLHCTTSYPCPMKEVNLKAMLTLKEAFKTRVGYSDHTIGFEIAIAALSLGASVLEKHLTIDNNFEGPDHKASMNPLDFKRIVEMLRNVELSLGNGKKIPTNTELLNRKVIQRSIVAAKKIKKGEKFNENNITTKRTSKLVLPPYIWDHIIGMNANRNYDVDDPIHIK